MIRPFADKMKIKQKAYKAKQKILAEQAEQIRIQDEWVQFDKEQDLVAEQDNQIIAEEKIRQSHEYLIWKKEFHKRQLREQEEERNKPVDTGLPMNHAGTWQLTWKSFSTHPDIINLPMSEKVRLYKIAERQQVDKLNYYASMGSVGSDGTNLGLDDGSVDHRSIIEVDTIVATSLDVNDVLVINHNATLTINGILTVHAQIVNNGTLIVNGLIIKQVNIINNGTLTIN